MNKRSIIRGGMLLGAILSAGFFAFVDPLSLQIKFDDPVAKAEFVMIAVMELCIWWKRRKSAGVSLAKKDYALAIIFGFFMMLGYGLIRGQGFEIFYGSAFTVIFSLAAWAYYTCFGICLLRFLYAATEAWMVKSEDAQPKTKLRFFAYLFRKIEQNRLAFYFILFIIAWLPTFLIHFPGMLMHDSRLQMAMYYGIPNQHTDASILINPDQYITAHHSVIHTVLIGKLLDFGQAVFGTMEAGILIYTLIQFPIMALTTAYLFKSIKPYLGVKWTFIFAVFFAVHPFFGTCSILMTKDIYFCALFVLYVLQYYELLRSPEKLKNLGFFLRFLLITIGLLLFRNNALYTLILIGAALLIFLKPKKQIALYILLFLAFHVGYTSFLMPALEISSGSPREALSVPFQQTAYYVNKYEDEVTEEEKQAISKILDYETMLNSYNPELSDPVKDTYNKYATTEELIDYFVVWFKMFLKHPLSYVEAFLHQNYGYYFPSVKDSVTYDCHNDYWARRMAVDRGIPLAEAQKPGMIKESYYGFYMLLANAPFTCLLTDTGIFVWLWIFVLLFILRFFAKQERKKYFLYFVPYFAYLIFILVGPANGTVYFRYVMPFMYTLPLSLLPLFEYRKSKMQSVSAQDTERAVD